MRLLSRLYTQKTWDPQAHGAVKSHSATISIIPWFHPASNHGAKWHPTMVDSQVQLPSWHLDWKVSRLKNPTRWLVGLEPTTLRIRSVCPNQPVLVQISSWLAVNETVYHNIWLHDATSLPQHSHCILLLSKQRVPEFTCTKDKYQFNVFLNSRVPKISIRLQINAKHNTFKWF